MSRARPAPEAANNARWLLPAEAYWSPEWFEAEQAWLFGRSWYLVGTREDVAGGRGLGAMVAGRAVTVRQAPDGKLAAWRIGDPLAGVAGGPAAVEEWAGLLFVHLDPDSAPTLETWLGDVPNRIGGFHPDRLVEVARHRFELGANWKLFVENHIDVYHLWYLHSASLNAYDHHRAEWEMCGPHWVFYEPPAPGVDVHGDDFWRGLKPIEHVGEDRWGSGAHLIFPNLTFATGAGFFMTYQCIPVAADRSIVDMRVRAEPGSDATEMLELSRRIIEGEDGAACEAMQSAVRSPWFEVGPLAQHHELPITLFQQQILQAVGA
jgi:Rieske 2Fe-2S family protein